MTTRRFNLLYFIYFLSMGIYYPFIGVYLEDHLGFKGSQIGTILGVGPIVMIISLPLFGMISDKTEQPRKIILLLMITSASIISLMQFNYTFLSILLIVIFYEFFKGPTMHLVDSITMKITKEYKFNYSGIRTYGSIGYVLGSLVIGYLINDLGPRSMFILIPLFIFIAGFLILSFPYTKIEEQETGENHLTKLLTNKNFLFIILISVLTFVVSDIQNAYNGIFITNIGGTMKQVGYATIFTVFFELFLMRYNKKLLKRFGLKKVLLFAVFAMLVRYSISYFALDVWVFYLAISMHGISVALVLPTALFYISEIVPSKLTATAITIYGAVSALIRALITFFTGYIYQYYDLQTAYLIIGILSLFAIPLVFGLRSVKD